jgi:hypothetical protein
MEAGLAATDAPIAVTCHLTPVAEQVLQELALRRGISIGQVIGEALMEKKFFSDQRRGGNEVVLRSPTGHVSPVRWPYT